jgi:cytochrome c556
MADYSINPTFANLSGLQPLQSIDVTRGGALPFQPLQQIQVVSSQPELVAQGIAGAIQGIGQGALNGITARWAKEEEKVKEERKYEHELELAGAKKKSEDLDFAQKELLKFDIAHSGDADYPERRKQVAEALTGRVAAVLPQKEPTVSVKKSQEEADKEYKTYEDPKQKAALAEVAAIDSGIKLPVEPVAEIPVKPEIAPAPLAAVKPIVEGKAIVVPALTEVKPIEEQQKNQPPQVDKVPLPEPEITGERFASRDAALTAKKQTEANPHWDVKVAGPDNKGYFHLETESKFKEVTGAQRQEREDWYKQQDLSIKQQKAAQDTEKSAQEMQIRQQKVKDENKSLADHVETAATSLRELDDIISTIEKNPFSVGKMSGIYAKLPVDTDASKVRAKLQTVGSNVAVNALTAMRQSSPTGGAVGNVSDKDMELFRATEGSFDPDSLQAKDILPTLKEIKRKRLQIYNDSVEKLKTNNPKYTPPAIQYPKKEGKKQESTQAEKVRLKAPYQKNGKDVFGTVPQTEVEQYLSKGYTVAPL